MDGNAQYVYTPCRSNQFRLCRFVLDDDRLSATLETFPVDGPHPTYSALSYTWGNADGVNKSWAIRIGDAQLSTLGSLRSFFHSLRLRGTLLDGTWWWIDSICIDQSNTNERDEHVRRMGDTYQNAHSVVIWLGEESDDSDCAIEFLYHLAKIHRSKQNHGNLRKIFSETEYDAKWAALKSFFLRRWWSRMWTVQESVIPSDIIFWCGTRQIDRSILFSALVVIDSCNTAGFQDSLAFRHIWNRRRAWLLHKVVQKPARAFSLSLLALAAYFCSNEATDPRDRLYGLTGLCTIDHGLEINYSESVEEVYLRFAKSFIEHHKSLDVIAFAALFVPSSSSLLPSWVPDWRARVDPVVVPLMASQSATDFVGNLRPPRTLNFKGTPLRYMASGLKPAVFQFASSTLLAHGCLIDTVDGLAGSHSSKLVQSSESHSRTSSTAHSSIEYLTRVCRCLVFDRGDRYLRNAMPTERFYEEFLHLCVLAMSGTPEAVHKEFNEWFQATHLLLIHGSAFEDMLNSAYDEDIDTFVRSAPRQDEYIQNSFYGRFYDTVERMGMRLMTSSGGRLGMAPARAAKGDLVCILFGCSVPVILRRSEHEGSFTLVGECFIEGCMEGEALLQDDFEEMTFRIT
jgi:hypothetical protein